MKLPIVSSADVERILDTMTVEGWIAIYAAVIATINAAWSIYSIWRDKPKLALKANLGFPLGPSRHGPICLYFVYRSGKRRSAPYHCRGYWIKTQQWAASFLYPSRGGIAEKITRRRIMQGEIGARRDKE